MKKITSLVILGMVVLLQQVYGGELDGTKWKAHMKGIVGAVRSDMLTFENGQFTSSECVPYGFKTSAYESAKEGGQVTWSATQTNDKGEKMDWKGTKTDGKMTGNYVWTKPDGKTETREWRAKMVNPKGMEHPRKSREHPKTMEHPKAK